MQCGWLLFVINVEDVVDDVGVDVFSCCPCCYCCSFSALVLDLIVAASATPWIMIKIDREGYAFSDILSAATMPVHLTSADDIQRYPVIWLFRDLGAGFAVEIKTLDLNGMIGNEKNEHAIQCSTLTASIMLHMQLKLYYFASHDDEFFLADDQTHKTTRRDRRLDSSTDRLKGPSEPVLPLRIPPRGPKAKPVPVILPALISNLRVSPRI